MRKLITIFKNVGANSFKPTGSMNYISKHGYHFTAKLAEYVSGRMVNRNGAAHSWTVEEIKRVVDAEPDFKTLFTPTLGDLTYLANMAYADFYPDLLKTEGDCVKYAIAVATGPGGYDGMAFNRWLADIAANDIEINWDNYL